MSVLPYKARHLFWEPRIRLRLLAGRFCHREADKHLLTLCFIQCFVALDNRLPYPLTSAHPHH